MTLYAHQQALIDRFPKRHLMAWMPRTGKTLAAIGLARKADCVPLIIVPKKIKEQWDKMCAANFPKSVGGYCLLTKEEFTRMAPELPRFNTVIVDEAHHFSGMKSLMSKRLHTYIKFHNVEHVYFLTGTPYRSTPWNIYRLATMLGLPLKYNEFKAQFFRERYLGRRVIFEPKPDCQDALADVVRRIGSIVRLEDCTDMPKDLPPIIEEFEPTPEQLLLIADITKKESNPLTRFGKYHQAASGILIGNEFMESASVPCAKDARIVELVNEYDRVIVFARFNSQLERYGRMLRDAGIPSIIINGETKDPEATRQQARELKYGAVLMQISGAEGFAMHEFSVAIYASLSYSLLDYEQSRARIQHPEKRSPNLYYILQTKGTPDEAVWASVGNKQSFSEAVYIRQHGL